MKYKIYRKLIPEFDKLYKCIHPECSHYVKIEAIIDENTYSNSPTAISPKSLRYFVEYTLNRFSKNPISLSKYEANDGGLNPHVNNDLYPPPEYI